MVRKKIYLAKVESLFVEGRDKFPYLNHKKKTGFVPRNGKREKKIKEKKRDKRGSARRVKLTSHTV